MIRIALAVLLFGAALARRPKPALADLAWMAGSWTGESRGIQMEEHWTAPKGNSMVGIHRDVGKGRTMLFEFLRIEQQGDQIVYLSMPNGRSPATPFPVKEVSGTRVVFENPKHDFPQRIIIGRTATICAHASKARRTARPAGKNGDGVQGR